MGLWLVEMIVSTILTIAVTIFFLSRWRTKARQDWWLRERLLGVIGGFAFIWAFLILPSIAMLIITLTAHEAETRQGFQVMFESLAHFTTALWFVWFLYALPGCRRWLESGSEK